MRPAAPTRPERRLAPDSEGGKKYPNAPKLSPAGRAAALRCARVEGRKEGTCYPGDVAPGAGGRSHHWWGCHQTYVPASDSGSAATAALSEMRADGCVPLPSGHPSHWTVTHLGPWQHPLLPSEASLRVSASGRGQCKPSPVVIGGVPEAPRAKFRSWRGGSQSRANQPCVVSPNAVRSSRAGQAHHRAALRGPSSPAPLGCFLRRNY